MYQVLPNTVTNQFANVTPTKYIESLVKGIADMVLVFNPDFRVIYANKMAGKLLNGDTTVMLGSLIYDFFPKKQQEFLESLLQETMEEEQVYNRSTQLRFGGKEGVPVSISFSQLIIDEELEGYMLVAKDISHLMKATDALKEKNEQLERLFYRMSHDLKGPLASIQGMLELAKLVEVQSQDVETYLRHISSSADKLKHTLHGLMQLQFDENEVDRRQNITMRYLLESVIDGLNNYPGRRNTIIHLTANPKVTATTDTMVLENALRCIIENSIKFRKTNTSDSVIKISVRNYKGGVKIKVKDNGLGMDRAMQQRAFDMFFRGHGHAKGSGLGLYITKNAIEKLGGEIKLKSQPFLGTEVSIFLPNRETSNKAIK